MKLELVRSQLAYRGGVSGVNGYPLHVLRVPLSDTPATAGSRRQSALRLNRSIVNNDTQISHSDRHFPTTLYFTSKLANIANCSTADCPIKCPIFLQYELWLG